MSDQNTSQISELNNLISFVQQTGESLIVGLDQGPVAILPLNRYQRLVIREQNSQITTSNNPSNIQSNSSKKSSNTNSNNNSSSQNNRATVAKSKPAIISPVRALSRPTSRIAPRPLPPQFDGQDEYLVEPLE